eukprot:5507172-Lingulodinium_polyedra.AAC.1
MRPPRRARAGGPQGGFRRQAVPCQVAGAWRTGPGRPRLGRLGPLRPWPGAGGRSGPCGTASRRLARCCAQARRPLCCLWRPCGPAR